MTSTLTDEAALLAAILAAPGDDAPRLVYADWLEEHAGDSRCAQCIGVGVVSIMQNECPRCHGTGRISDGRAERAEFIRVQIELAGRGNHDISTPLHGLKRCCDCGPAQICKKCVGLRQRERELYPTGSPEFPADNTDDLTFTVRRGFVASVACTLADWFTHGPRIVRRHPIETVRLTDWEPFYLRRYSWTNAEHWWSQARHGLPTEIYTHLQMPGHTARYPTDNAAFAALSTAALTWARTESANA